MRHDNYKNSLLKKALANSVTILPIPSHWGGQLDDFKLTFNCQKCDTTFQKPAWAFETTPSCPVCLKQLRAQQRIDKRKVTYRNIVKETLAIHPGAKILSPILGVPQEKADMVCENGNRFSLPIEKLQINKISCRKWCSCEECKKFKLNVEIRSTEEPFHKLIKNAKEAGLTVLSREWLGYNTPHQFQCLECGAILTLLAKGLLEKTRTVFCTKECVKK